jgi:geranylgeranyl pyrophosphate synthase
MLDDKTIQNRLNLINKRLSFIREVRQKSIKFLFKNIRPLGGKRIRGLFVLITAEAACGRVTEPALNTAAAIELLHHATLIHDDIVDGAKKRRGAATLNRRLGYEFSVLAGDYLLSRVNSMIFGQQNRGLLRIFAEVVREICEGEIEEIFNKGNAELGEKQYLEIIRKKTASLIRASVEAGAVTGGIKGRVKELAEFGTYAGMAFQIKDDILDMTSSVKNMGKPVGGDIKEGKATLPFILALRNSSNGAKERMKALFRRGRVKELIKAVKNAGGMEDAEEKAAAYIYRAKKALRRAKLKYGAKKGLMEKIADYVIERNY